MFGLIGNGAEGKNRRERFSLPLRKGEVVLTTILALIVAAIIYLLLT